ncbi:MAG: hypothetical protein ACI9MR_003416, partial [Myxococcota bacterium]
MGETQDSVVPVDTDTNTSPDADTADPRDTGDAGDTVDPNCAGEFGCPCLANNQCDSGWCVASSTGFLCTRTCLADCPQGFDCRQGNAGQADPVFLCMPRIKELCTPCTADFQCIGGACLAQEGEGRCGFSCADDAGCPTGFGCSPDPLGVRDGNFCQPESGSCNCTAEFDGGQRTCEVSVDGLGSCFGVEMCQPDVGFVGCSAATPSAEVCDGFDNDCNGEIDEGVPVGEPCMNTVDGVGACAGTSACLFGGGEVCQGPVPAPEICDGQDNNCDGLFDEGFTDADGRYTLDAHCGVCGNGCADRFQNGTGVCGGEPTAPVCVVGVCEPPLVKLSQFECGPAPDATCVPCDNDSTCFGGTCANVDGVSVCANACNADGGCDAAGRRCQDIGGGTMGCVPSGGSCACTVATAGQQRLCFNDADAGRCIGIETCDAAGGWLGCDALTPAAELCDGVDNDCDGSVDNQLDFDPACTNVVEGVGACPGTRVCEGSLGFRCLGPTPTVEVCDFVDNDCDGLTDEDFSAGGPVPADDENCGVCGNNCDDSVVGGSGRCGGTPEAPACVVDTCDDGLVPISAFGCGLPPDTSCRTCESDADCLGGSCITLDGQNVCVAPCAGADNVCQAGYGCSEVNGEERCVPDSSSCTCNAATVGQTRSCDFANTFGICNGQETCDPAQGWVGCDASVAALEVCNGLDDDCDGLI